MPLGEVNFVCLSLIWTFIWVNNQIRLYYFHEYLGGQVRWLLSGWWGQWRRCSSFEKSRRVCDKLQCAADAWNVHNFCWTLCSLYHLRKMSVSKTGAWLFFRDSGAEHTIIAIDNFKVENILDTIFILSGKSALSLYSVQFYQRNTLFRSLEIPCEIVKATSYMAK